MPAQKLQFQRFLRVIPSDTIDIPNPSQEVTSGTATATTSNKLVDSAGDFVTNNIKIGDIIYNTADNTVATVTAVDSATTLSVSDDIFANTETYRIFEDPNRGNYEPPCLYIGTGGTATFVGYADDEESWVGVPSGFFLPGSVRRVKLAGLTDMDNIIALW